MINSVNEFYMQRNDTEMKIAVVTGASSGVGAEFVIQLAKKQSFDEIWLIARRKERLVALGERIDTPVRAIALDLLESSSFDALRELLEQEQPLVDTLVNASGFGYFKAFCDWPLEKWLKVIDLNDKALVAMCGIVLPYMQQGSKIYNIVSSSAFQPVPYMAVYGASKAFALSYSRALGAELRERKIRVLAACPHYMKTEFFDTAVKDDTIVHYSFYQEPSKVVAKAIRDMERGRDVSTQGFMLKAQTFLIKHLPHKMVMRTWCRQQKKPW